MGVPLCSDEEKDDEWFWKRWPRINHLGYQSHSVCKILLPPFHNIVTIVHRTEYVPEDCTVSLLLLQPRTFLWSCNLSSSYCQAVVPGYVICREFSLTHGTSQPFLGSSCALSPLLSPTTNPQCSAFSSAKSELPFPMPAPAVPRWCCCCDAVLVHGDRKASLAVLWDSFNTLLWAC